MLYFTLNLILWLLKPKSMQRCLFVSQLVYYGKKKNSNMEV